MSARAALSRRLRNAGRLYPYSAGVGSLKLVFFGTPQFALPSLAALRNAGHEILLVISQPDRPAGRRRQLSPPPVAAYARENDLPLLQTSTLRDPVIADRLRSLQPEAMALAAFAAIVPGPLLDLAPLGILNVHPSLLPRWRGAAPIQSALLAGDAETGVSIIRLVQKMDAGRILLQRAVPISALDDYVSLQDRLARLGAVALVEALTQLRTDQVDGQPQDETAATYARKITREDGRIDWARPADEISRQVRAYRGWPRASTSWNDRHLQVLRATPLQSSPAPDAAPGTVLPGTDHLAVATGDGALRLDDVIPQGSRAQTGAELLRGHPNLKGARLA